MHKKILANIALSCGLVGGMVTVNNTTASARHLKSIKTMPKYMRGTWYRGKEKIRITAHTLAFANVGQKFTYPSRFQHVSYSKITHGYFKGHRLYRADVFGDIPSFVYSHHKLYRQPQQSSVAWPKYHR